MAFQFEFKYQGCNQVGLEKSQHYNESLASLCSAVRQLVELRPEFARSINTDPSCVFVLSFKCHNVCSFFRWDKQFRHPKKSICSQRVSIFNMSDTSGCAGTFSYTLCCIQTHDPSHCGDWWSMAVSSDFKLIYGWHIRYIKYDLFFFCCWCHELLGPCNLEI